MKKQALVILVAIVVTVTLKIGSYATENKMISIDDAMKIFEGTYVNTDYSGQGFTHPQKIVLSSNGEWEIWRIATQKNPSMKGEYQVENSWMDSKGNIYCTVESRTYIHNDRTKELWKLDKSRKIYEANFITAIRGDLPREIDPDPDPNIIPTLYYQIYYRQ
jgi:hypothetical protein